MGWCDGSYEKVTVCLCVSLVVANEENINDNR